MTDELLTSMQEVFREVFDDDELVLASATTADDVDGWDSLMHINLVVAVEKTFGVRFATAEIAGLKEVGQDVGTFRDLLARKLGAAQ